MTWIEAARSIIELSAVLATMALVVATLLDSQRHLIDALVSMAKRKATTSGQHSRRAVRERCADPHKHSGCDGPLPVKRHS